jgi:hypothetical protein
MGRRWRARGRNGPNNVCTYEKMSKKTQITMQGS